MRRAFRRRAPENLGIGNVVATTHHLKDSSHQAGIRSRQRCARLLLIAMLLVVRIGAAELAVITDCDEVFNYWEPLHFLLYGSGLQTWEYSPEYALRSYLYLLLFKIPVLWWRWIGRGLGSDKTAAFQIIRIVNAGSCFAAEVSLAFSMDQLYQASNTGNWYLLLSAMSAGMFYASPSVLPSSFTMIQFMFAYASWLSGKQLVSMMLVANAVLVGWPFVGLLGIPLLLPVERRLPPGRVVVLAGVYAASTLAVMTLVDSAYYGRIVVAPMRLVLYNVFPNKDRGPEVFGTEPWSYYIKNSNLNFPLLFAFAVWYAAVQLLHVLRLLGKRTGFASSADWRLCKVEALVFGAFLSWLAVFSAQAHKEERFLYPIYPLVCWGAARCTVVWRSFERGTRRIGRFLMRALLVLGVVASWSRIIGQQRFYAAPFKVFRHLAKMHCAQSACTLCMGDEWHHFPSSFFLPGNTTLRFVRMNASSLLPKPFVSTNIVPEGMNDRNAPVYDDRFVASIAEECDFFAGLVNDVKAPPAMFRNWTLLASATFLDRNQARGLCRAFYIPGCSMRLPTRSFVVLTKAPRETS